MRVLLALLFGGIVAVTLWGFVTIPEDRRWRISFGAPPSVSGTMGKSTGLIWWLVMGGVVFAGTYIRPPDSTTIEVIAALLLAIFLAVESWTVHDLRREPR